MNLCNLNCCDLKYLQAKFDAINKKISNNQELQDRVNKNMFELLRATENGLKDYYALNESVYIRTLSSEDDINTLEPGTYKIVSTDMPQNAPSGVASSEYDGTLIQSNSYAVLFENGFIHIGTYFDTMHRFRWNYVINSNLINIHLQYYMLISNYQDGEFIDDIHNLNQRSTGVYIVNSETQNLPVQQNGIIIVRIGTATNSLFVTFIPEDSFDIYYCAKKADGTWTEWGQAAFMSDVPSLAGYATQEWVNQQIQDITGGSVTADWVKANFESIKDYISLESGSDLNNIKTPNVYYSLTNILETIQNKPNNTKYCFRLLVIRMCSSTLYSQIYLEQSTCNTWIRYFNGSTWSAWNKYAFSSEIPSLSGYATQAWVQSQYYLTEIPEEYATDTEVSQAIAAALVNYATQAWVNSQGFAKETDIPSLTGYATQSWVNSQGFLTEIPDEYVTTTELQAQNYATQSWVTNRGYQTSTQVDDAVTEALNGYATQTWVNQQNFAHESDIPNVTDYATESWVNSQNFATEEWVGQQGYQTVQQVNSLINTATADMLTQEDLETLNYATENWVLQTALNEYATIDDITNATSKNNILKYQLDHTYFNLISKNTDLNTLSIGVYSSDSLDITTTLLNKPQTLTRGFKLTMSEIVGEGYYSQTIIENITGKIFIRCSENYTWNEWREI